MTKADEATIKYELLDDDVIEPFTYEGQENPLYRVHLLIDLPERGLEAGELGGYIESEDHLSQQGACFVAANAVVYGGARVADDAFVAGSAIVRNGAIVRQMARVLDQALVEGHAVIQGRSLVLYKASINGTLSERFRFIVDLDSAEGGCIGGEAMVLGYGLIGERAIIRGRSYIEGNGLSITGNARIQDEVLLEGAVRIRGDVMLTGTTHLAGSGCYDEGIYNDFINSEAMRINEAAQELN